MKRRPSRQIQRAKHPLAMKKASPSASASINTDTCQKTVPKRKAIKEIQGRPSDFASEFYKNLHVNGQELCGFVDTGSSDCTIKTSVALLHDFSIKRQIMKLRSFGPIEYLVNSPGFVSAKIIVNEVEANDVEVRVVPDDCQPVDLIIGRMFTELPHVAYHKERNKLVFQQLVGPVVDEAPDTKAPRLTLDVELPLQSMNFITVCTQEKDYTLPMINFDDRVLQITKEYPELKRCELRPASSIEATKSIITLADIGPMDDHFSETIAELLSLLNEYRDCIAMSEGERRCTNEIEMDMKEVHGSKPVMKKTYPASENEREYRQNRWRVEENCNRNQDRVRICQPRAACQEEVWRGPLGRGF